MANEYNEADVEDGVLSDQEMEAVAGGSDETHAAGHSHGAAVREFVEDCVDTVKGWFS